MVRQAIASAIPPEKRKSVRGSAQTGSGEGAHRPDAGSRPASAAQAAAHGAPDLDDGCATSIPSTRSGNRPCGDTCSCGSKNWGSAGGKCSCRRATTGARKGRSIGLRRWPSWAAKPVKLQFFAMRSMGSGDAFHRAYTHATQQALLEAHEHAFDYFGGVFRTLRYDNMTSLVKKILRGRQRIETDRIIAFRSHWGYQSEYCNPASGNEKGGVEGELGWYRRNCLVPVPEAAGSGGFERAVAGGVCGEPEPDDQRQEHDHRASQRARTDTLVAAGRRGLSDPRDSVSAGGGWEGPREGEDQLVLDTAVAGVARDGAGLAVVDRDPARRRVRGPAPALLWARSSDPGPGTLPGCVGEEAGSDGGFHTAGAMAAGRPLARVPGSDLAASSNSVTARAPGRER